MPIKVIARVMGCSKNTVKAALASEGPPRYVRVGSGSIVDEVEPRIRELLAVWPTTPATVIAERCQCPRSPAQMSEVPCTRVRSGDAAGFVVRDRLRLAPRCHVSAPLSPFGR
jgi:hypothetical protein